MAATFPPSLGGNGQTYDNESFALGGHRTNFVPALEQVIKMAESAVDSATDASASKTAAKASETAAKTSETAAANFANAAQQTTLGFDTNRPTIKPSLNLDFVNQQVVDRRIVVNRNSPKTYFGKEKVLGDENLLRYSEDFSNGVWVNDGTIESVNTEIAPDGTLTADTVTAINGDVGPKTIFQAFTAKADTEYWVSIYVKSSTNKVAFFLGDGTSQPSTGGGIKSRFIQNPLNGVVEVSDQIDAYSILSTTSESAPNGFFRFGVKVKTTTDLTAFAVLYILDGNDSSNYTSNGTESVIVWGAQLETAREGQTKPTAYVRTDAYPVRTFFNKLQTAPANTMPVEFDPITKECLGIKPESQATNLVPTSSGVFPILSRTISLAGVAVAPDNTLSANSLIPNTETNIHSGSFNFGTTVTAHVFSVFVKAAGYSVVSLYNTGNGENRGITVDLNTGLAITTTTNTPFTTRLNATITNVGDGWFRISSVHTPAINGSFQMVLAVLPDGVNHNSAGNGFSGVLYWGRQIEQSTLGVPSSYIPTTTAAVTRLTDDLSMPVSAFEYNQNEGALYVEVNTPVAVDSGLDEAIVDLSDGSGNERVVLFKGQAGSISNAISFSVVSAAITGADFDLNNQFQINTNTRFAVSFARNNVVLYNDGQLEATDSSVEMPTSITKMQIGNFFTVQRGFNGYIRALRYYPKALSALEAQALSQI